MLVAPELSFAQGTITTVAGVKGVPGFSGDNGPATSATLSEQAYGVTVDASGNVYIADTLNHRVRKVIKATGIITTIAGNGTPGFSGDNGPAISAQLNAPLSVAVDAQGNVYVSDQNNDRVRRISSSGTITTYAGSGQGNFDGDTPKDAKVAKLSHPFGLSVDASGTLFIADTGNHRIRKVSTGGIISTVAGSGGPTGGTGGGVGGFAGDGGPATSALLKNPSFVAVDGNGNVFIADELNERVRWVRKSDGLIFTLAGTGVAGYNGDGRTAASAQLNRPYGVATDTAGNVYIADYLNFRIRKVANATGASPMISTFAGIGTSGMSDDNLPATAAALADPVGVFVDAAGVVYEVDQSSFRIRKITPNASVPLPATPTGVVLTQSGPTSANMSWSPVAGATGYIVKVSLTAGAQKHIVTTTTSTLIGIPGLTPGQPYYFVVAATNSGGQSPDSVEVPFLIPLAARPNDFDGDRKADPVVWRPGSGTWYWLTSSSGYSYAASGAKQWGAQSQGDVPFLQDIDGDRASDLIVWRAATGTWFWLTSSSGYNYLAQGQKQWGAQSLGDIPLLGDVDGDRRADLIVWRASTGTFFWLTSSSGYVAQGQKAWGNLSLGDRPFVADFDADGISDLAVWRASTGFWYWLTSRSGYAVQGQKQWGSAAAGDVPLLGDLDGDGRTELIVWRAPTGTWYWVTSTSLYVTQAQAVWGVQAAGDVPLLSDFDGDGRLDLTVWRGPTGIWYWLSSASGFAAAGPAVQWGAQSMGDIPIVK